MTDTAELVAGRYRLAERIGAGAMGVVWRARDERLGRTVALKQLAPPPLPDHGTGGGAVAVEARQRMMREGRIAARLHHPNAITVFDVVDHRGAPWLVMEYLPARSLATVLAERGQLPVREVAAIGRQLADALAAAHDAGIVHRDVKPGNVLLGQGGVAKLTDFGISRAVDDVAVTRTGMLSGTPAYLAPEVARGAQPTPASDVFALGATLYAAVEGQPPFGTSDNALAVLHQVARGQVRPPRQAGPLTPPLMRLLAADPHQRPTMAQARDALAALLAAGPVLPAHQPTRMDLTPLTGRPAAAVPATSAPQRRGRRPGLLVAAGVALAVLAGLLVVAAARGPRPPAAGAATPVPQTTTPPATPLATATPPPVTTTTRPPATTTSRAPTAAELQRAVTAYYELLPDHPDQAWAKLSPSLQSVGLRAYRDFWSRIESVQAVPSSVDPKSMTVRVLVVYRIDDRRPQAEVRDLVLVRHGEAFLIDRDQRVAGAAVPTTTRKRRG